MTPEGIVSAVSGLDGVSKVRDMREQVAPILGSIDVMQKFALGTAAFLVFAALLLVANTIRLAAFARRKEIGIMRLVGASKLYIALPFLLESLVTALLGVALAGGALALFQQLVVVEQYSDFTVFPLVDWADLGQEMWSYLTGRGAAVNYNFVDMAIEVPRDTGPEAPRATWKLNGTLRVTTEESARGSRPPQR